MNAQIKSSKFQPPSSRETSSSKPQIDGVRCWEPGIWRFSVAWMLVVGALFVFTGCNKSSETAAPNSPAPQKQFIIGMSQCNLGEPWRVQMNADMPLRPQNRRN
jgi:hypothetical protein